MTAVQYIVIVIHTLRTDRQTFQFTNEATIEAHVISLSLLSEEEDGPPVVGVATGSTEDCQMSRTRDALNKAVRGNTSNNCDYGSWGLVSLKLPSRLVAGNIVTYFW